MEIAKEYRSRGGVGRLVNDTVSRDASLDPPEADDYWNDVIKARIDSGDFLGIFQHLR